jgi:outer membrane lipopolysaccharide assembly protein LptE/RlpB
MASSRYGSPFVRIGLRLVWAAAMLSLFAGCGYRLAGSAENRLAPGQSLWVPFIANESVSPTAQTVIRRALLEESHAMRGLSPAASLADADLSVSGSLRSYALRAVSFTSIDHAREYRLTIEVELELRRKGVAAPLWKGTLQAFQDFPANANLALQRSAEESALAGASRILAQKFLTSVEQSY